MVALAHITNEAKKAIVRLLDNFGLVHAEAKGPHGSIRAIQIFEAGEGERIFRFVVTSSKPVRGEEISLRIKEGTPIDVALMPLETWCVSNDECSTVLSLELSCGVRFCIGSDAVGWLDVGRILIRSLVEQRNRMMVNPGIDRHYSALARTYEWHYGNREKRRHAYGAVFQRASRESPLFSVVIPLYKTPEVFLRDAIDSVLAQTFEDFELMLVNASSGDATIQNVLDSYDDPRIKVIELNENQGIVGNTNVGIEASCGQYIAFMDHDDVIEPRMLETYASVIESDSEVDVLYCDEDSVSADGRSFFLPRFKPDFNEGLISSYNYICHMLAISRWVLEQVVLSDESVNGAQDYDLSLKAFEVARRIFHVPSVLYHWRNHAGSTNGGVMDVKPYAIKAGEAALRHHYKRESMDAQVESTSISCVYRTDMSFPSTESLVVVVSSNEHDTEECVRSLETQMGSFRTVVTSSITQSVLSDPATCVNEVVVRASEKSVVLVQDTVRFSEEDSYALNHLLGCLVMPNVGIVAPKGFYADGLVQHAGLCVKEDGTFGFLNQNFTSDMGGGYLGYAECLCDFTAVGSGCIAITQDVFQRVGGMSEGYIDPVVRIIDLCFKVRSCGLRVMVDPFAQVINYASVVYEGRSFPWNEPASPDLQRLWGNFDQCFRRDVLYNPYITFETSYPQLKV